MITLSFNKIDKPNTHATALPCTLDCLRFAPQIAHYGDESAFPNPAPMFIDADARITREWKIENLQRFSSIEEVFHFEKCLECLALLDDNYAACRGNPCLKCVYLAARLRAENGSK